MLVRSITAILSPACCSCGTVSRRLTKWAGTVRRAGSLKAHHFLLWQSVLWLKENRYTGFDLGGINETTPGIAQFKIGMGGQPFRLVGGYV